MRARSRGSIVLAPAVVLASAVGCATPLAHTAGGSTASPPGASHPAVHFRVRVATGPPALPADLVSRIGYSFAAPTTTEVGSAHPVDGVLDTYWTSITETGGSAPEATVAYLERVTYGATGRGRGRLEWVVLYEPTGRSVILGRPHPRPSSTPAVTVEFDEFDAISGAWIRTTER